MDRVCAACCYCHRVRYRLSIKPWNKVVGLLKSTRHTCEDKSRVKSLWINCALKNFVLPDLDTALPHMQSKKWKPYYGCLQWIKITWKYLADWLGPRLCIKLRERESRQSINHLFDCVERELEGVFNHYRLNESVAWSRYGSDEWKRKRNGWNGAVSWWRK